MSKVPTKGPEQFQKWAARLSSKAAGENSGTGEESGAGAAGGTAEVIALNPTREQQRADLYAAQAAQIDSRIQKAVEVENETKFLTRYGGKTFIVEEGKSPTTGKRTLALMTRADYRLMHENNRVEVPSSGGRTKHMCFADVWLGHPDRRQYLNGVALLPAQETPEGVYNLWRGWGVEPVEDEAKCLPLLRFLFNVICSGDKQAFAYLIGWMAYCVQNPGKPAEVAVVMRGGRGVGKSTLLRWMVEIFGEHGLHIQNSQHLVGRFNAHLQDVCFIGADEAFFVGDRQGAEVLKGLITEPSITIERKGVDAVSVPNRLKVMMASNAEWVIPAGTDERRYFVLDVSDAKQQDRAYFSKLQARVKGGGLAALLHKLLNMPLGGFDVGSVPRTAALDHQVLQSLAPVDEWLYSCLYEGAALDTCREHGIRSMWAEDVMCTRVADAFTEFIKNKYGRRHIPTSAAFIGRALRRVFPELGIGRRRVREGESPHSTGELRRFWTVPPLDEARAMFAKYVRAGDRMEWPE